MRILLSALLLIAALPTFSFAVRKSRKPNKIENSENKFEKSEDKSVTRIVSPRGLKGERAIVVGPSGKNILVSGPDVLRMLVDEGTRTYTHPYDPPTRMRTLGGIPAKDISVDSKGNFVIPSHHRLTAFRNLGQKIKGLSIPAPPSFLGEKIEKGGVKLRIETADVSGVGELTFKIALLDKNDRVLNTYSHQFDASELSAKGFDSKVFKKAGLKSSEYKLIVKGLPR